MKAYRQRGAAVGTLQVFCILLLIALLVGILVMEGQRGAAAIGKETARTETMIRTDALVGYVFREETALHSSNNGPVEYLVADGDPVRAGDPVARVYVDDTNTDKRAAAAVLYDEIARLEAALEQDAIAWQLSYMNAYSGMMDSYTAGSWQTGLAAAGTMAATLEKRSVLTGDGEAVRVRIATLRAQAAELVRYVDAPEQLSVKEFGYFSSQTDGYEASFGISAASELTPEKLKNLLSQPNDTAGNVGKWISGGAFYLAVPICAERAAGYRENAAYRVHLTRGGQADARLMRIAPSADGSEALLILQVAKMPQGMDFSRRQPLVIEREYVTGLSIPAGAVFTEGDAEYVYVSGGGVAVKRQVRVLCREGGGCIVATGGGEGYLCAGESVLVTARSVYEGKELLK